MPAAPLGTSSQSKNNKRASQPLDKANVGEEQKENIIHILQDNSIGGFGDGRIDGLGIEPAVEQIFPATPVVRIPLEDLIGNTEDAFNCTPSIVTPKDHVLWQNGPRSSASSTYVQSTQRGQKRARSSSPVSPSRWDRSNPFQEGRSGLAHDSTHKPFRTPNNDPSHDLWNRYTKVPTSRNVKDGSAIPKVEILLPSSPQTPNATSKDSAFRRTVSCGIEWPTSKSKRRRIDVEQVHSRTKTIFAASKKEILASDLPKASRVGLLVEKIQESLLKRPTPEEGPSSSSPLPDRYSQLTLSPTRQQRRGKGETEARTADDVAEDDAIVERSAAPLDLLSSEFGDDGLDLELLESFELAKVANATIVTTVGDPTIQLGQPEIAGSSPPDHDTQQSKGGLTQPGSSDRGDALPKMRLKGRNTVALAKVSRLTGSCAGSENEFDDEDDSFSAALQDLAAQYDSQKGSAKAKTREKALSAPSQEFDEDLEDDEDLWKTLADETGNAEPSDFEIMPPKNIDNRTIKRYLIADVIESQYKTPQGRQMPEKLLSIKDERTGLLHILVLRQSWYHTRGTKGSYVHLIGEFDYSGQCIVDDANNMVILHPDHLISSTVVGDSFTCTRRAALQDRIKATSAPQKPQVYGHILHEVFGAALKVNRWDVQSIKDMITKILPNYIESLYEIQVTLPDAIEYLLSKLPELAGWANLFVGDQINTEAVIQDRNGVLVPTKISRLLELEEHVWSPMYGLKGNIDATVQSKMQHPGEDLVRTLITPLELKTGRKDNVETHRAQTALYTLLLSDRYDVNVTCGILYYLESSKSYRIENIRNEIRHMIIERNELACYVHDKLDLPPMIKRPHLCKSCYSQSACFTYHKLIDGGDEKTSGIGEKFNEVVGHLKPVHQTFFKKWDDLLTKEERDSMKFRRELWTMLSAEREAVGRCFSNVVIEPGSVQENPEAAKINRFQYTFVKHKKEAQFSFTESQITVGEPIVVSDEKGHFNLASGYVTNVRPTRIVVVVDRRLKKSHLKGPGFDAEVNQILIERADETSCTAEATKCDEPLVSTLYRIDKDEFANGMATARNNLLRMMEKDLWKARELRQLIIENVPPAFQPSSTTYVLSGPSSQQELNVDQRLAIEKVLSAKDYALVLGMPGTGKTTTIAHLIRALVSQNKSVLLTSYTHTAVDNILLKIKNDNIPVLRLGAVNKVHPEVKDFADLAGIQKQTIEELHNSWHQSKVVATTCLGVNHGIFNARTFDYCIVDEASQITLPVCLGPIRMARTFILVGDHYQLPPLVQNKEAQEGGLNISLFKLLSDAQPQSVVNLEHQYRMAEDIMLLSRDLVYEGRLKCGTQAVADRLLHIPNLDLGLNACHYTSGTFPKTNTPKSICTANSSCWLLKAMTPQSRCLFLNTDSIDRAGRARETAAGSRITNASESKMIAQLVTALIQSGIPPRSIGVITFYRSQLAILKQDVKSYAGSSVSSGIEMHTADKYQGRDKEVILLSCVRSNSNNHVGDLLRDWRRVNVAVTRARSKLLIFGSKGTLAGSGVPVLEGLVRIMENKSWILNLPENAMDSHVFECNTSSHTQTQTDPKIRGGNGPQQARTPLRSTSGNFSPRKTSMIQVNGKGGGNVLRTPAKVVHGAAIKVEKLLDKNPVVRDVMNELALDS